jgi:pyruvate,orthophosphate dikinase
LSRLSVAEVAAEKGVTLTIPIGTMIELPRAALTAHRIADAADFVSFGTNDLGPLFLDLDHRLQFDNG